MLHIDNDMDEMMRRAAQDYPLNTGQGDWESVRKKINEWTEPVAEKKSFRKKFLYLLFFIVTGMMLLPLRVTDIIPQYILLSDVNTNSSKGIAGKYDGSVVSVPAKKIISSTPLASETKNYVSANAGNIQL